MATPAESTPATSPPPVVKKPVDGSWTTGILDVADDPVTCLLGYCCPCVIYGQTAEKIHGGDCVLHGLKFYLYSCICACGLVSGPTRAAIRTEYSLPVSPEFLKDQGDNADCLTGTIPFVNCLALCQDYRETNFRNVSKPIYPGREEFDWAPLAPPPAKPTVAPAQAEISK